MAGIVSATALGLVGCGGGAGGRPAVEPAPLTIETTATVSRSTESSYRTDHFTFALPGSWAEKPTISPDAYGTVAAAAAVAPDGAAPSSVVLVLAYDVRGARESEGGPRAWFDWYARTTDAEVAEAAREVYLDGGDAWEGSLKWTDRFGNPVEVRILRAVRGGVLFLIQCQAEPADRAAIAAGCATIVNSFDAS